MTKILLSELMTRHLLVQLTKSTRKIATMTTLKVWLARIKSSRRPIARKRHQAGPKSSVSMIKEPRLSIKAKKVRKRKGWQMKRVATNTSPNSS